MERAPNERSALEIRRAIQRLGRSTDFWAGSDSPSASHQLFISTGVAAASWSSPGNNQLLGSDGAGALAWEDKPFFYNQVAPGAAHQAFVSTGVGTAAWTTAGASQLLGSDGAGAVAWEDKPFFYNQAAPDAADKLFLSTGDGTAAWSAVPFFYNQVAPDAAHQVFVSTGVGTAAWTTAGNDQLLGSDGAGAVVWEDKPFFYDQAAPDAADKLFLSTGASAAAWSAVPESYNWTAVPAAANQFLQSTGAGSGNVAWVTAPVLGGDLDVNGNRIKTNVTNGHITLQPNGNGSIVAMDAGTTARGNKAVDLQLSRSADTQVASGGSSVLCGGISNTASGAVAFIGGGATNIASGASYATVCAGRQNTASGNYTFVGGGYLNVAAGGYSVIVGGYSCTIASDAGYAMIVGGRENSVGGTGSNYATIVGGYLNEANALGATVSGGVLNVTAGGYTCIGGGWSNTAGTSQYAYIGAGRQNTIDNACDYSVITGGRENQVSAAYCAVSGGYQNKAGAIYSAVPGGFRGVTEHLGALVHANFANYKNGDAQRMVLQVGRVTSATTQVELFLDRSSARLTLAQGDVWDYKLRLVGVKKDWTDDSFSTEIVGLITYDADAGTTVHVDGPTVVRTLGTPLGTVTVDEQNHYLRIRVTPGATDTMIWHGVLDIVKVNGFEPGGTIL